MVFRELKDKINKWSKNLLLKSYDLSKDKRLTQKPSYEIFFNERPGIKHPEITPTLPLLLYIHNNSPPIKIATMRLRESIFRRGFEWERKFESKCSDCKKEFEDVVQQCDGCGSKNIKIPDMNEIKRADKFFKQCNIYDPHTAGKRKLLHLLKQIEDDINIYDDAYLIGIKEYWQNDEGDIKLTTLHQILRGNPVTMRLVGDEYGEPGGKWAVCLRHRDIVEEISDNNLDKLKCRKCGRKLYEVHYVSVEGGGDNPMAYYIGDEVIHACYDDQTEVLTKSGFKLFKNLLYDDEIATLNKDTNNLEYQLPSEIQSYDYNGEMYNIDSRRINLSVTPNHRIYVKKQHGDKFEFIEAQNLDKHSYYFRKDCNWEGKELEYFILSNIDKKENLGFLDKHFDDIKIPMDLWLEFLGYYISEGSTTWVHHNTYHVGIAQSKNANPDKYAKIEKCLDKISTYWHKNENGFGLTNKQLASYLYKLGKSHDKYIPNDFMNLSQRQLKILFDALLLGDGSICYAYCTYTTTSKKLSDQIYELGIKCGYTSKLTVREINDSNNTGIIGGREIKFKNGFIYLLNFGGYINKVNNTGTPSIETSNITTHNYNGKVYCCTVPNSIIMVRRNGVHIWCGNSKYAPSSLYGFSPIVTLWQYCLTLTNMMEYIYRSYTEAHLPKGILAMRTSNPDAAFEFWRDVDDKLNKDPHYIPKMFLEGDGNGTGSGMEFVKFMDTLEEMQYIPVRDEIRRTIASLYGVTNIFIGDTSQSGGLNSEDTQIDITSMAAESGIAIYNDHIMPELLKWLNINDWNYELQSPFEENIQRELNENQSKVTIMQSMLQAGFDIELGEEDVFDFKYSGAPKKQDTSGGFGGFDGQDSDFGANPEEGSPGFNDSDIKMGLEKSRIYVKHPNQAPQGSKIQRGVNGAYYYDTTPQRPHEEVLSMNKRRRIETLLHSATEHYENLLEEYKHSKDVNPGHAMSLQGDLQETRQMIRELQNNYKELFGDQPEMEKDLEGRNININIQKYLGESPDNAEALQFQKELNKIFDEEISKILNSTKRFSGDDIKVFTKQVLDDAIWKMRIHTNRHIRKLYDSGQAYVGELVGKSLDFSKVDEMAIKAITERKVLWNAYANMEKELSKNINDIITESYKDPKTFSIHNMVNKMREATDAETYRLERIVRTETRTATQKGREMGFKKVDTDGKYRYNWAIKHDSRTSDICKDIEEIVKSEGGGRGVTLDRLNEILKTISKKHNGETWEYRDWTPHINCRSGIVRSFVEEPISKSIINDVSNEIKKELIEKEKYEEELKIKKVLIEKEEKERLLKEQEFKIKEQELKIKEQELNLFNKKIALMDEVKNMPEVI